MRCRNLFWLFVSISTLALVAAAPMSAYCDDNGTDMQLDTGGDKPIQDGPGITHIVDARALPALNPDGQPPIVFAFSTRPTYTSALQGFDEAYYLDMKLNQLRNISPEDPVWPDRDCSDYKNTNIFAEAVYLEGKLGVNLGVTGVCSGKPGGMQGRYDPDSQTSVWVPLDLQAAGVYEDLTADSRVVGDRLYQIVCGANTDGVNCWEPEAMQNTPVTPRAWQLPGGGKLTNSLGVRYDKEAGVHMVGTDSSGQLGYVSYAPGTNQPKSDTFKWLGQASQNQSWAWTQVGVAPTGTVYAAAFNSAEGALYVFRKAADSADHWFYFVMTSSSGAYGKYLGMDVDNKSGNAMITYRNGEGRLAIMILTPDGRRRTITAGDSGSPYSTAAAAGNGLGNVIWPSEGLDSLAARVGVKLEF